MITAGAFFIEMESTQEIDRVLDLLDKLKSLSPGEGVPDEINQELLALARLTGAGPLGERGEEYERLRHAVENDDAKKQRLVDSLFADRCHARSWAGSFIEQLFLREEAVPLLTKAVEAEPDPETASWLCLSLARSLPQKPEQNACAVIGRAYDRAKSAPDQRGEIARAWGYAGCREALPPLAAYLSSGGYDQKAKALDGMLALGSVDDPAAIAALWNTFDTAPWLDHVRNAADLLVSISGSYRSKVIKQMVEVLASSSATPMQRLAAAQAIKDINLPAEISETSFETFVAALSDESIAKNVLSVVKLSYSDWGSRFADLAVQSPDEKRRVDLIRALANDDEARASAVGILRGYATHADPAIRDNATTALKEMGGKEAFATLQELLQSRYIQPSERLQNISYEVFEDTVKRMRRNYEVSIFWNHVIFWLGFAVIVAGVVSVLINPSGNKFFGTAGIVAGLGTLVSLFFFGPMTRVQEALTELVQIEVAFMAFMHRLLQSRSIFEQLYLKESIDLDSLARFDELLEKGMTGTIELMEKNIGKSDSKSGNL